MACLKTKMGFLATVVAAAAGVAAITAVTRRSSPLVSSKRKARASEPAS